MKQMDDIGWSKLDLIKEETAGSRGDRHLSQGSRHAQAPVPMTTDVCMRLRAEYLFCTSQYDKIHFKDVNGNTMKYSGGSSRSALEDYLRKVFDKASTYSLSRELRKRPLRDIQPGDELRHF